MWVNNHTKRCFVSQFANTIYKSIAVHDSDANILCLDFLVALAEWISFRRSYQYFVFQQHA